MVPCSRVAARPRLCKRCCWAWLSPCGNFLRSWRAWLERCERASAGAGAKAKKSLRQLLDQATNRHLPSAWPEGAHQPITLTCMRRAWPTGAWAPSCEPGSARKRTKRPLRVVRRAIWHLREIEKTAGPGDCLVAGDVGDADLLSSVPVTFAR